MTQNSWIRIASKWNIACSMIFCSPFFMHFTGLRQRQSGRDTRCRVCMAGGERGASFSSLGTGKGKTVREDAYPPRRVCSLESGLKPIPVKRRRIFRVDREVTVTKENRNLVINTSR